VIDGAGSVRSPSGRHETEVARAPVGGNTDTAAGCARMTATRILANAVDQAKVAAIATAHRACGVRLCWRNGRQSKSDP